MHVYWTQWFEFWLKRRNGANTDQFDHWMIIFLLLCRYRTASNWNCSPARAQCQIPVRSVRRGSGDDWPQLHFFRIFRWMEHIVIRNGVRYWNGATTITITTKRIRINHRIMMRSATIVPYQMALCSHQYRMPYRMATKVHRLTNRWCRRNRGPNRENPHYDRSTKVPIEWQTVRTRIVWKYTYTKLPFATGNWFKLIKCDYSFKTKFTQYLFIFFVQNDDSLCEINAWISIDFKWMPTTFVFSIESAKFNNDRQTCPWYGRQKRWQRS